MDSLETQLQKSFLWLERMQGETPAIIKENLDIAQKKILTLITETQNQRVIKTEINKILNEAFEPLEDSMEADKAKIQELSYNATSVILANWTTIKAIKLQNAEEAVKKRLANPNSIIRINDKSTTVSKELRKVSKVSASKISSIISEGFSEGKGIDEIDREIRNVTGAIRRNQLNAINRTFLLQSIRKSQNQAFDYFESEIVEYYYNGTIDTRQTARCFALTTKPTVSKNKSDITKLLEFHWNCRSILGVRTDLSNKFDEEAELNVTQWNGRTVNHRDGTKSTLFKVDDVKNIRLKNITPEKAFSKFDKEFQIAYMGKERYALYSQGKLKFEDMISISRNTFIPLDKLKKNLNL